MFHVATAQQPPPIPVEATESCAELITMYVSHSSYIIISYFQQLSHRCMAIDPTQRSTADQLLEQSVFLQPLVSKRKAMSGMCSHPGNLPPSVNNVNSSESAISTTAVADDSSSQLTEDVQMTGIVIDKRAITDRNKNLEKNIANINSMKNPGDKTEEKIDLGSSYASIKSAFESSVAASSEDV